MRVLVRIIFLLLLLGGPISAAQAQLSAREYLNHGNLQLSRNDFPNAIGDYTKALELDPSFAEAYVRRGIALRLNGSLTGAIQDFERAERIDPRSILNNRQIADSYSNRGYIEMKNLELGGAINDFTKAIKAYEDAIHYFRRGQARLIDEDLPAAIEDFDKALSFNLPNDFLLLMIYANRGYALLLKGRKHEAESDFQRVLEPNSGYRVIIELHLRTLETQIKEMRRKRIQAHRNIS